MNEECSPANKNVILNNNDEAKRERRAKGEPWALANKVNKWDDKDRKDNNRANINSSYCRDEAISCELIDNDNRSVMESRVVRWRSDIKKNKRNRNKDNNKGDKVRRNKYKLRYEIKVIMIIENCEMLEWDK